jgi:protoporphyrinogen oxidase
LTLFDRNGLGGLANGFHVLKGKNFFLDKYYHHIFKSDLEIIESIQTAGLGADLSWRESRSAIFSNGALWSISKPHNLLTFSPLGNIWQRTLMTCNLLSLKLTPGWEHLDGVRCREFFERRLNLAGYRNLWKPLLQQKFGEHFDNIPASFLWGRIYPRSRSREKGKESLGYLKGGFQRLFLAWSKELLARGAKMYTNNPLNEIAPGTPVTVTSQSQGVETFDKLIWTAPLDRLSAAMREIPSDIRQKINSIKYIAVKCLVLVMKKRLGDYYWVNNIDPDVSFGAAIEHTNLVPPQWYGNNHVLYVVNYHEQASPTGEMGIKETIEEHLPSLKKAYPSFSRDNILRAYLFKDKHASPLYDLHYAGRIPPYSGWIENVDLCGMAQVYPGDRNMNNCLRNAIRYLSAAIPAECTMPEQGVRPSNYSRII